MRRSLAFILLLGAVGPRDAVLAASFDCSQAATPIEALICEDAQLSRQDLQLAETYQQVLAIPAVATEQKARQRQWLRSVRNACPDVACLRAAHAARIVELQDIARPMDDAARCAGEAKRVLDLAAQIDGRLPEASRATRFGRRESLNLGRYWLKLDIAQLYAKLQCWQSARQVIAGIEDMEAREASNAALSVEYAKAGYFGSALEVLVALPSEEASAESAFGIAEAMVAAGRLEQARQVAMRITTRWSHLESPSYVLMRALTQAGRLSDAEKMLARLRKTWNEHLLLASAYLKTGQRQPAQAHIRQAAALAGRDPDAVALVQSRSAIIYADAGDFDQAQGAASRMRMGSSKLQVYTYIAERLHRSKRLAEAAEAHTQARAAIRGEVGDVCRLLARGYARTMEVSMVESAVAMCPDAVARTGALEVAILELAKQGELAAAQQLSAKVEQSEYARRAVAILQASQGSYEPARAAIRSIVNEALRSGAVEHVAFLTPPAAVSAAWLEDTKGFKSQDHQAAAVQVLTAALARAQSSASALAWLQSQPATLAKARGYLGIAQGSLGIIPGQQWPYF